MARESARTLPCKPLFLLYVTFLSLAWWGEDGKSREITQQRDGNEELSHGLPERKGGMGGLGPDIPPGLGPLVIPLKSGGFLFLGHCALIGGSSREGAATRSHQRLTAASYQNLPTFPPQPGG